MAKRPQKTIHIMWYTQSGPTRSFSVPINRIIAYSSGTLLLICSLIFTAYSGFSTSTKFSQCQSYVTDLKSHITKLSDIQLSAKATLLNPTSGSLSAQSDPGAEASPVAVSPSLPAAIPSLVVSEVLPPASEVDNLVELDNALTDGDNRHARISFFLSSKKGLSLEGFVCIRAIASNTRQEMWPHQKIDEKCSTGQKVKFTKRRPIAASFAMNATEVQRYEVTFRNKNGQFTHFSVDN